MSYPMLIWKSSGVLTLSEDEAVKEYDLVARILPAKGCLTQGIFWMDLAQLVKEHGGIPVVGGILCGLTRGPC